ncbi:MAG: DNA-directed RNA polymerase subunit beta, partial [Candidatus Shikimatogenerans bostrichidophilus]
MGNDRIYISEIEKNVKYIDFLRIQIKSFKKFLDIECINRKKEGLYQIFKKFFPIYNKEKNFKIDFLKYYLDPPINSVYECIDKDLTYGINIYVKFKIFYYDKEKIIKNDIQSFYLCTCPYITNNGSFIFNGAERVVIYQLHRSPGIFFGKTYDYNGVKLYYARIIPMHGSWLEFVTDNNNIIYTYINKKKKIYITSFLRAIGYKTNEEILEIFGLYKKIKIKRKYIYKYIGRKNVKNIYNKKKKNLLKANSILDKKKLKLLINNKINTIYVYSRSFNKYNFNIINNIFNKDRNKTYDETIIYFYKLFKTSYPPNIEIAKVFINRMFYDKKKYNLGLVCRYKLNIRFNIKIKDLYLTKLDYKKILNYLLYLLNNKNILDDIDHLSNRQVKTVGDQLYNLFTIGISRIYSIIKEKINIKEYYKLNLKKLINSKLLNSILNSFFGTSQVSQFMDKTNPLSEMTHKRRITLLGPGGLNKSRASFEARDVNYSHYGRLCPIETPEGPNIGLIYSLCLFANINNLGFLETPYKKVVNGKVYNKIYFLTSDEEKDMNIGQYDIYLYYKYKKKFVVRKNNENILTNINKIDYIDYSPNQMVSLTASLIPFIEHNDANRALMGSNMMRQSLPLLKLEEPIVGTGVENKLIFFYRNFLNAKEDGIVKYVDSNKIIIKYKYKKEVIDTTFNNLTYTHKVPKFHRTNQNTCYNLTPIVKKGDIVKKNQILCEGFANKNGVLSLGKNLLVAFMSWRGYNFEDAIIVSKKLLREDSFTSIHIEVFSLSLKKIKYGYEEFTKDLPNINSNELENLDDNGIIKIGATVKPGDILIGKIIPKEETYITPEQKLLKSIFGNKASNVKEVSLRAPSYLYGIVIDVKIYKQNEYNEKKNKNKINKIRKRYITKLKELNKIFILKLFNLLKKKRIKKGIKIKILKNNIGRKIYYKKNSLIDYTILIYLLKKKRLFKLLNIKKELEKKVKRLIKNFNISYSILRNKNKKKITKLLIGDILPPGVIKTVKVYVAQKRKLKVGDKMSGRHGNKGVVARIVRDEDMPFLEDGTVVDIILNPLSVPSRMNLGQVLESILGYIGYKTKKKFYTPIFEGCTIKILHKYLKEINIKNFCRYTLYDGISGEKFQNKITIGIIYMLKLGHMVDDKIHTRSIGPYSLITQQPLGGKSQLGGQRFGEMEVWALEAYGASNILRELLTIKSDDIEGRIKTYESIIKGLPLPTPNIPESFKVLIKELKGLCLNISLKK